MSTLRQVVIVLTNMVHDLPNSEALAVAMRASSFRIAANVGKRSWKQVLGTHFTGDNICKKVWGANFFLLIWRFGI
jgi:hypothetical protein